MPTPVAPIVFDIANRELRSGSCVKRVDDVRLALAIAISGVDPVCVGRSAVTAGTRRQGDDATR